MMRRAERIMTKNEPSNQRSTHYLPPELSFGGWILVSCITVVLAFLIRTFIFQTFEIPSTSMTPTLEIGDHVLVNKFCYGVSLTGMSDRLFARDVPKRGEVIVFSRNTPRGEPKYFIKRIIGVPGDRIEVNDFQTFVNGKSVEKDLNIASLEKLLKEQNLQSIKDFAPKRLDENEYFVLGDNRLNSEDSRFFGPINFDDILGRASVVYFSWRDQGDGKQIRWNRLGKRIR